MERIYLKIRNNKKLNNLKSIFKKFWVLFFLKDIIETEVKIYERNTKGYLYYRINIPKDLSNKLKLKHGDILKIKIVDIIRNKSIW